MICVIDNYDSFTYNVVQALGQLGAEVTVCRNDRIDVDEALALLEGLPLDEIPAPAPLPPERGRVTWRTPPPVSRG